MESLSLVKQHFIDYIDKIIEKHTVSHAYLIEVNDYLSDMNYIYDFIKMILCGCSYEELSTSKNNIIHLIDDNNYPDIKIIEPDGSFIKKSQLLELQAEYSNKSLLNNKRIYIIKYAEKLNASSANTMLKFLEEPEDDIIAFLVTNNRYHIIDTILSRCQILTLKDNNNKISFDENIFELLSVILNPREFFLKYKYFLDKIVVDKNVMKEMLIKIENIIIGYFNYKNGINQSFVDEYNDVLSKYDDSSLLKCISIIEDEYPKLEYNVNYKLWVDSFFSKLIIGG